MKKKIKTLVLISLFLPFKSVYADAYGMCHKYEIIKALNIISVIILILKIIVPALLIISATKILFKSVIGADKVDTIVKSILQKVVLGLVIFFIPSITNILIGFIANYENSASYYTDCAKCLTSHKYCDQLMTLYPRVIVNKQERKVSNEDIKNSLSSALIVDKNNNLAGNSNKVDTNYMRDLGISANEEITAPSNSQIISKGESSTLKYSIEKKETYYITRIWVADAYNQLRKYDSPKYGTSLSKPSGLIKKAISDENLQNKIIIGFNASGFYLKGVYDKKSVEYYEAYDKTSVGTVVITNGVVKRNAYNKYYKTWTIMGINPQNKMILFQDEKASTNEAKKSQNTSLINTGIKNTFSFASPLVINGKKSEIKTSMPSPGTKENRQAICQIDSNNYAIITGKSLNRNDLINIMLSLNCQTGTNLDGGGSTTLLIKKAGSTEIETIIGNKRSLSEVGYFTEL